MRKITAAVLEELDGATSEMDSMLKENMAEIGKLTKIVERLKHVIEDLKRPAINVDEVISSLPTNKNQAFTIAQRQFGSDFFEDLSVKDARLLARELKSYTGMSSPIWDSFT